MLNYPSMAAAEAAGAVVTHTGMCGVCSTRQDLSVYMNYFDMTAVGKVCGLRATYSTQSAVNCFMNLGMT